MLRSYRSAILAIGLICFPLVVIGQGPENLGSDQPIEQQPAKAQAAPKATPESQAVAKGAGAPAQPTTDAHNHNAANKKNGEAQGNPFQFWGDTWAQWLMAGTGVLALFVSAWAVWLVRGTLVESRKGTEAAIRAAKAAEDTVDVTSDIGRRQIRAYVGIDTVRLHMSPGGIAGTIVGVINTGQTPAKNLISRITFTARPYPSDAPLPVPEKEPPARSRAILPSGKIVTIENVVIPIPFEPQYQRDIANRKAAIFVHGVFTYDDIFDEPHTTKFCLFFTGAWGGERKMDVYHTGNEAD